jgi:hypothetical protein
VTGNPKELLLSVNPGVMRAKFSYTLCRDSLLTL